MPTLTEDTNKTKINLNTGKIVRQPKWHKNLFADIRAENIPNIAKEIHIQVNQAYGTPNSHDKK